MKIEEYPNKETEFVCSMIEGVALTLSDVKNSLMSQIPIGDSNNIYRKFIDSSIDKIDWDFVQNFLNRPPCTDLVRTDDV